MTANSSIEAERPVQELLPPNPATAGPSQDLPTKPQGAIAVDRYAPEMDPTISAWIDSINNTYASSVEWIIQTGNCLTRAKSELNHGRWGLLFGKGRLKFGQRKAEMLMKIVRCPELTNANNFANLPGCWSVLYRLTKVPADSLAEAIARGRVHPKMTLREARELVACHRVVATSPRNQPALQKFNVDKRLDLLARYFRREAALWPQSNWAELAEALREIAADLLRGKI